jgi:hypothetical protein
MPTEGVDVVTEADAVVLIRRSRSWGGEFGQIIRQRVPITWTPCSLGGRRPWFRCDAYYRGRYCGRRVALLYSVTTRGGAQATLTLCLLFTGTMADAETADLQVGGKSPLHGQNHGRLRLPRPRCHCLTEAYPPRPRPSLWPEPWRPVTEVLRARRLPLIATFIPSITGRKLGSPVWQSASMRQVNRPRKGDVGMLRRRNFVLLVMAAAAMPAWGQTTAPAVGPGTHSTASIPDFSGIWVRPFGFDFVACREPVQGGQKRQISEEVWAAALQNWHL